MRLLITGGSSLVARRVGQLLAATHEILYAGRRDADFPLELGQAQISFPSHARFDAVIHCAADFGGDKEEDVLRAEMVNAVGAFHVARIAQGAQARHIILISTSFAANGPEDDYYNAYSLSKRHGEELSAFFCRHVGLPLTILRPVQVYGDQMEFAKHQPLFYHMIRQAARGEDILLFGNRDPERAFLHVDDLAAVIREVLNKKILGLHTVAEGQSYRLTEIAALAYEVFGTKGRVSFDPARPDIAQVKPGTHSPTLAAAGILPLIHLSEGLRRLRKLEVCR